MRACSRGTGREASAGTGPDIAASERTLTSIGCRGGLRGLGYGLALPGSESVRILRLPAPGIYAHFVQPPHCAPAELLARPGGIRIADCDVPGTASHDSVGHLATRGALEGRHHLQHAVTP